MKVFVMAVIAGMAAIATAAPADDSYYRVSDLERQVFDLQERVGALENASKKQEDEIRQLHEEVAQARDLAEMAGMR